MIIIPAIDLLNGEVVRLRQGKYDEKTVFEGSPESYIERWQNEGAQRIHIVDLEGARSGGVSEWDTLERMLKKAKVPLELGGGLRNLSDMERAIKMGISFLVLGTVALTDKKTMAEALRNFSDQVIVGVDVKAGMVRTQGWLTQNQVNPLIFLRELEHRGIRQIIYTNIAHDGMMIGPDMEGLKSLLSGTNLSIIASGGVSSLSDIEKLAKLNHPRLVGVICGRALYDGQLNLREAQKLLSETGK